MAGREAQAQTALITGASGFVGRHLIAELTRETDWTVVGLARRSSRFHSDVRVVSCDLRNRDLVDQVLERYRPQLIFHLAAQSYVPRSSADPAGTLMNNITSQVNLLEASRALEPSPRILIVSSGEIYGPVDSDELPITERAPFRPQNPYAVSKATQDLLGYQYHAANDMRIIRARPFNHIGPGQDDRFVVGTFARQVAEVQLGRIEPTILTGNLDVRRDFLDVRDVVAAYRLLIRRGREGAAYNVASGRSVQIGELLRRMIEIAGIRVDVRPDPARMRSVDVPDVVGDASALAADTGWSPQYSLEQTLADTLKWWRSRLESGQA
ncbi:MAG: GDP-mannose 4,6-dehydratase [Chloroflexota bacterium]